MQSDFEAKEIKNAKAVLEKDLQVAEQVHARYKEHKEKLRKSLSLLAKIKNFFRRNRV
jgi:hypothetical protein